MLEPCSKKKNLILFSDREKKSQQFFNAHFLKKRIFFQIDFFHFEDFG